MRAFVLIALTLVLPATCLVPARAANLVAQRRTANLWADKNSHPAEHAKTAVEPFAEPELKKESLDFGPTKNDRKRD